MLSTALAPGCNMPSIPFSPEHPDLWWVAVEATETGLISALTDEDRRRSDDRFKHLAFFPTFSSGTIAFHAIAPGEKVTIDAASENSLTVTGNSPAATYEDKIVVLYHSSLDAAAVVAFYAA